MIPALVVPEVATTAATEPGSPSAARAARSPAPVSRWSSDRTTSGSISSMRSVLVIEECASSLTATRHRRPEPRNTRTRLPLGHLARDDQGGQVPGRTP